MVKDRLRWARLRQRLCVILCCSILFMLEGGASAHTLTGGSNPDFDTIVRNVAFRNYPAT